MTATELRKILDQHAKWIGGHGGAQADRRGADLRGADLRHADLQHVNLQRADLRSADLQNADLCYADLRSANLDQLASDRLLIVPSVGSFVGWKSCRDRVIVKLLIPAEAKRSNATSRKCRASHVLVEEVFGSDVGVSMHDESVVYRPGHLVQCHEWEPDRWVECGGGIHFFITRSEAEAY